MSASGEPLAPVPGDEQELQREIERTREHLGDSVDQLAAKADVRAHAKAKAAELTGRLRSTVGQAKDRAAAGGGATRQRGALMAAGASVLLGAYLLRLWWRNR